MREYDKSVNALFCSISAIALLAATSATAQAQTVLDTITVVATKTEENVWDTLAPVSIVRREDIERVLPSRVSDAFFGVPGVSFPQRGDDPANAINIRGLQDFGRVAVVVDGARQNFQRSGHQANGQFFLDPEMIGGADVVRGPVANIYGSGAIGGVVSFRTKDAEDVLRAGQRWGIVTTGMIGSNDYQGLASAFAAARPNDNVEVIIGGVYRDRDEYKAGGNRLANPYNPEAGSTVLNSGYEMGSGLAKLTFRPADGHEIKFSLLGSESSFDNGTPGASNIQTPATINSSNATNYIANANYRYHRPDDRLLDFSGNVYWTETELEQTKIGGANSSITGNLGSSRSFKTETTGIDLNNTSRFDIGGIHNAFTIGGDYFKDKGKTEDETGVGDLFTPNGERTVGGGFAQLKSNYQWVEVVSALRYDTYDLTGSNGGGSDGDRFSPKVTVGITPVKWFTVYGSYAEGYRAPTVTETFVTGGHPGCGPGCSIFEFLQNPDLQPEVGKNKEIGVNLRFDNIWAAGDAWRLKANLFRNDVDNYIDQVAVAYGSTGSGGMVCNHTIYSSPGQCYQYQNITKARIEGFELESRYDAGRWFLNASYTLLDGTNESDGGSPLYNIPANTLTGTLGFRFLDNKLTTAINLLSVAPKDPADVPEGSLGSASYNIVNLNVGYRFNEDMAFNATVENLFDEWYAPYGNYTTTARYHTNSSMRSVTVPVPNPGITFKGALTVRFGDTFFKNQ
jgi:hemoglobin/transferrin/lactoferrin receptor protein